MLIDDMGTEVRTPAGIRRVVSLVPSLTETVAATRPEALAGATAWCSHPPGLRVERIGGTKNPDVARVAALRPDLVLANEEENRPADLDALRERGLAVWVTKVRTVDEALASLRRVTTLLTGAAPDWLTAAERAWAAVTEPAEPVPAIVPIWRRPWMVAGRDTFAGDVLRRLGAANLYAGHAERYPRLPLTELNARGAALVVLPDEPYAFSAADGPEAFPGIRPALVSGRHLTWYGPSLAEAPAILQAALA